MILSLAQTSDASITISDPVALLSMHRKKLTALRLESGYNEANFRTYIYQPLLQCARYVHAIPASRAENHREPGGLLRFSLETAFLAFRRADGKLFPAFSDEGVSSRDVDLTWRYSAFVAGLCLSLGRAAAGVRVRSLNGQEGWNPYAGGLIEWAQEKNLNEYVIEWRNGQDARSPTLTSTWFAAKMLDKSVLEKLYVGQGQIVDALLDVVMGRADSTLSELIRESVNSVIDQDLSASRQSDGLPTTGIRVEHRVLDAIRGLIRDKWTTNTSGSRIWVTEAGVFINWKPAVNDIVVRLRADGITGVPNNPDTVAELLIEKSILMVNKHTTTLPHYFRVVVHAPHIPKHPMDCVRVTKPILLGLQLDAVSPVAVEVVGQPRNEEGTDGVQQAELDLDSASPPSSPPKLVETGKDGPNTEDSTNTKKRALSQSLVGSGALSEKSQVVQSQPTGKLSTEESQPSPLHRYGEVGKVLEALARGGTDAFLPVKEGIALAYPSAIEALCERPKEFLTLCQTQSLLVPEKGGSNRVVRKRRKAEEGLPEQYIVFVPRLAKPLGVMEVAS
jgi:hypothetical protein